MAPAATNRQLIKVTERGRLFISGACTITAEAIGGTRRKSIYSFSEGKTHTAITGLSDDAQSRAYCSNRLGSRPVTCLMSSVMRFPLPRDSSAQDQAAYQRSTRGCLRQAFRSSDPKATG